MPGKHSNNSLPKNWPTNIPYLQSPSYSPALSSEQRSSLRIKSQDALSIPPNTSRGACPMVKITPITDPTHPAHGQAGLFATKDLKPGSFIIEYLGVIHSSPRPSSTPAATSASSPTPSPTASASNTAASTWPPVQVSPSPDPHAGSDYDLSLCRVHDVAIDAGRSGNEARFVNDYRGVRARPNAHFCDLWDGVRAERGMGLWVLPPASTGGRRRGEEKGGGGKACGIKRGEEILVSYGRGFWGARRADVEARDEICGNGDMDDGEDRENLVA